jgi:hypothetical protein
MFVGKLLYGRKMGFLCQSIECLADSNLNPSWKTVERFASRRLKLDAVEVFYGRLLE